MVGLASPQPLPFGFRVTPTESTRIHPFAAAASVRLSQHLGVSLKHVFKEKFSHVHKLKKLFGTAFLIKEVNALQSPDTFASTCSACLYFLNGGETGKNPGNERVSQSGTSRGKLFNKRKWTNVLLAVNIFVYISQVASQGKLLLWGAKINSLIDRGQLWRLATSSFLHANVIHLMVNCFSLNSVGPTMENVSGPRRFLAVYMTSAIASSMTSYWFSKAPSVGASGAIFGLVGSLAVFIFRHRGLLKGSRDDLQQIAQVILLNMVIGLSTTGIDNWGHVGGLLGGAATSWLIGPAWKYESRSREGRRIYADKAPIFYLAKGRKQMR